MKVVGMLSAIAWTGVCLGLLVYMIETAAWVGVVVLGVSSLLGMCTMLYGGAVMIEEFEKELNRKAAKDEQVHSTEQGNARA